MQRKAGISRIVRTACAVALAVLVGALAPTGSASAASNVALTGYGADTCAAPSTAQMRAFWSNTPYSYWGIYIGGSDRGCAQPNLSKTWVSAMVTMGWDLLPIWVGPQNPCTPGQAAYFSTNTTTAYAQGKAQALAAYKAWKTLSTSSSVPIDYDLEASSSDTATCRAAAKSFINGWVAQLHVAPAQVAGVYSSSCAGYLDDFATIANKPDFIDAADWDGSPSTGSISCVASGYWSHVQRHKQYLGGHNATYNGVTLNIDSRCANGPVYGAAKRTSTTHACAPSAAATPAVESALAASSQGLSWRGSVWQAGGPLDSELQRAPAAAPATWTPVSMSGSPVRTHDVSATAATIGTVAQLGDGSLLVPVTRHDGGATDEALYTSSDGVHFTQRADLPLTAALDAGVGASTAVLPGSRVFVLDPHGLSATVWSPTGTSRFATSGLPAPPQSVSFSDAQSGQAVVEVASCGAAGKAGCAPQTRLYRTVDGGHTWH